MTPRTEGVAAPHDAMLVDVERGRLGGNLMAREWAAGAGTRGGEVSKQSIGFPSALKQRCCGPRDRVGSDGRPGRTRWFSPVMDEYGSRGAEVEIAHTKSYSPV